MPWNYFWNIQINYLQRTSLNDFLGPPGKTMFKDRVTKYEFLWLFFPFSEISTFIWMHFVKRIGRLQKSFMVSLLDFTPIMLLKSCCDSWKTLTIILSRCVVLKWHTLCLKITQKSLLIFQFFFSFFSFFQILSVFQFCPFFNFFNFSTFWPFQFCSFLCFHFVLLSIFQFYPIFSFLLFKWDFIEGFSNTVKYII